MEDQIKDTASRLEKSIVATREKVIDFERHSNEAITEIFNYLGALAENEDLGLILRYNNIYYQEKWNLPARPYVQNNLKLFHYYENFRKVHPIGVSIAAQRDGSRCDIFIDDKILLDDFLHNYISIGDDRSPVFNHVAYYAGYERDGKTVEWDGKPKNLKNFALKEAVPAALSPYLNQKIYEKIKMSDLDLKKLRPCLKDIEYHKRLKGTSSGIYGREYI